MTYMSLSVVVIDLGNLRGQMFSHTGFAPNGYMWLLWLSAPRPHDIRDKLILSHDMRSEIRYYLYLILSYHLDKILIFSSHHLLSRYETVVPWSIAPAATTREFALGLDGHVCRGATKLVSRRPILGDANRRPAHCVGSPRAGSRIQWQHLAASTAPTRLRDRLEHRQLPRTCDPSD